MLSELRRLRQLLELHPRLDGGLWWAHLGGFFMNVHKLLENTLFECELYLGHALTFEDRRVRAVAEQNLAGCYQKRLLEAARFGWIDGLEQMMAAAGKGDDGGRNWTDWAAAAETFRRAATQKDGWGWAVNYGEIWMSEAAARLVVGAKLAMVEGGAAAAARAEGAQPWVTQASELLERGGARANEGSAFGPAGHPWAAEIGAALAACRESIKELTCSGDDACADAAAAVAHFESWLGDFKLRTLYWCAQALGGAAPFPPQPRVRLEDAAALRMRLPGHNEEGCFSLTSDK